MALNATSNSSGQTTTQSPQSAVGSSVGGAQTGGVQSGTPNNLLTSSNGISLSSTALTTVSLNPGTTTATSTTTVPLASPAKHHINSVLLGFSGLLIVVAIVLFWVASRSVKSTT
ncbi:MAG TPA: hypothetical protein VH234_06075 [Candidatus Saccharimonadales bacterium]|nr:hypothetical protein [Candidatus Saccharimonadales bacterium]